MFPAQYDLDTIFKTFEKSISILNAPVARLVLHEVVGGDHLPWGDPYDRLPCFFRKKHTWCSILPIKYKQKCILTVHQMAIPKWKYK